MSVPTTTDFADGVLTSSTLNAYVRDPLEFLLNPPAARVRQAAAQALATSVWTSITFDTEDLDSHAGWDAGTPARYTAQETGWYWCSGGVGFVPNTTGIRGARLAVGGVGLDGTEVINPTSTSVGVGSRIGVRASLVLLSEGDYVEVQGFQSSGGALNTSVGSTDQPSMDVAWARPA